MKGSVACIGAAHVDRKARVRGAVMAKTSNPATVTTSHGGVARNVAEVLARLGVGVGLVSMTGDDAEGRSVVAALSRMGIDTRGVVVSADHATASYTALIDGNGDLFVAFADMAIYDDLDTERLRKVEDTLHRHAVWFLDCNLTETTLSHLLRSRPSGCMAWVDGVSVPKVEKVRSLLDRMDGVFLNMDEAARLTGMRIRAPLDVCEAGYRLLSRGVGTVIITRGADGVFVATPDGADFLPAVPVAQVRDVTGAGDALIGGTLFGCLADYGLVDAVRIGLACAASSIETDRTVNDRLTADMALGRAGLALAPVLATHPA